MVYVIISFITFWMLFSYLVPISLFVTMEIVRYLQGVVFINMDQEMASLRGPESGGGGGGSSMVGCDD